MSCRSIYCDLVVVFSKVSTSHVICVNVIKASVVIFHLVMTNCCIVSIGSSQCPIVNRYFVRITYKKEEPVLSFGVLLPTLDKLKKSLSPVELRKLTEDCRIRQCVCHFAKCQSGIQK